jgi:membrane protein required for beta-lactamase induction
MEWVFSRSMIVALAVVGGLVAALTSWLQAKGALSAPRLKRLNIIAYGFMAASMVLFIVAGFRNAGP